ncbi:MAG TPA: ATP-dependent helicase [Acidimicrobiales bacterium]|nr:ATP-dependent helicase [Acidimicrobiales bacterium]
MFDWLDDLNPEQRAAVVHNGGNLLIVAGAGSGKTKTLACRVARLLADGVRPERILLLTFSRRAAREMLARAGQLAEADGARRVWGGTFHAVGNRLLQQHGRAVGLRPGFTVLDQGDNTDMLGLLRHDLGLGETGRRFPKKDTLASIYTRVVNAQEKLADVVERAYPWCRDEVDDIKAVFTAYTERKRATNVVDYDDLLLYWRALAASPTVAPLLHASFDHILVDEFQDTNAVQADIVAAMAGPNTSIAVVGDDAQAIYGFRAGSAQHMIDFPARFAGATVITLDRNYRSTPEILDAANAVIAEAGIGFAKELRSTRPGGARPVVAACVDELAQSAFVCDNVLENRERGIALHDQAVLFRTGHHSDGLELELSRRNIPFVKYGGLKFLEKAHVKDMLCLLRILDNPSDELAWARVLGLIDGVGPATIRRLTDELGVVEATALSRLLGDECPAFPKAATDDLEGLRSALADCANGDLPPSVQVERLALACVPLFARRYPGTASVRLADLEHLRSLATDYRSRSRFLAELTLDPPVSTSDLAGPPHLDDDYLILSTIHSAKGGEWRAVHVIHASDGNIPSDMALSSADETEEERRLLYVALTRARDTLVVSYPLRYYFRRPNPLDDAHAYGQPSRFLATASTTMDTISVGQIIIEDDPVASELAELWN